MEINRKQELSKYRQDQAEQCLRSAKLLFEAEDYRGAANRAYYAIYHAIRSIIAYDGVDFKRHSGNMSYFRQEYIKTGIFDVELSDMITLASEARGGSDYNDFYMISKTEVQEQINNAEVFLNCVETYLSDKENNEM